MLAYDLDHMTFGYECLLFSLSTVSLPLCRKDIAGEDIFSPFKILLCLCIYFAVLM
jgi:hypothetical protein